MADEKPGLTVTAVEWLKGQPFNNVLLLGLLGAVLYGGYFAIKEAIPAHLTQIQTGYEKAISTAVTTAKDERESQDKAHREEREQWRSTIDKLIDRRTAVGSASPGIKSEN